jgi:hypothetical protein
MSPTRSDSSSTISPHLLRFEGGRSPRLRWGERVPLDPLDEGLQIDLTEVEFIEPTFALRLAACAAVHAANKAPFEILAPRDKRVAAYLDRVGLSGTMGRPTAERSPDILVPVSRLLSPSDVEPLGEQLHEALCGLPSRLQAGRGAMMRAFSELCDNASSHGDGPHGAFLLAQRYGARRLVLTVGDLGIGIPRHLVDAMPELGQLGEGKRIVRALEPGVSGAGQNRGDGLANLIEAIREPEFPSCELRIWSGSGRVFAGRPDEIAPRAREVSAFTKGTWAEVVLTRDAADAGH